MADVTQKQYVDYAGLSYYHGLLKTYIDSAETKGIKKVIWDETNEKILFFKDPDATIISTADFEVEVSSADVVAIKNHLGVDATDTLLALNAYENKTTVTEILNVLTGTESVAGSVAKLLKDAIEALDVEDFALASKDSDDIITIKGIKEVDGKIAASADTTKDVTFAKVAATGKAEDISVAAKEVESAEGVIGYKLPAGTAQATAEHFESEIATVDAAVKALSTSSVVTVEKQESAETGYAATYIVKQNDIQVGEKINIPKDWLLKNVTIKTCTEADKPEAGYKIGDRYFDFEFNVKDGGEETTTHTYLKVEEMYDAYESGSLTTDAVVIVVDNDNNTISATVTDKTITRAKITEAFDKNISDLEATHAKNDDGTYKTVAEEVTGAFVAITNTEIDALFN